MTELAPGDRSPRAVLPDLDGGEVAIPRADAATLVILLKASCPTCRWAAPWYEAFHARTAGRAVSVVGVFQDDPEEVRALVAELGIGFPVALESSPWETSDAFGARTVPSAFLLDAAGEVLLTSVGFSRDDLREVGRRVAELGGGEPIDPFPAGADVPAFRPG